MLRIVLLLFFFSMACMGQTFQYSRGWTNGKRSGVGQNGGGGGGGGGSGGGGGGAAAAALSNYLRKEDDGLPEMFDIHDGSERRLERCLMQLQHLIRNPLLLHTAASSFGVNSPLAISPNANGNSNTNNNKSNNNNSNNNNNNPFGRSHQSNELFEELTSSALDGNDYGKQH